MTNITVTTPVSLFIPPWEQTWTQGCPISRFPDEILAEIFVQCVYGPCKGHSEDFMLHRIDAIYRRVYTLIKVCISWQRIGVAYPNLWLVVPIINPKDPRYPHIPSNKLILQRARSRNLHLVISANDFESPLEELENLAGHWHRFSVINFWSDSLFGTDISDVFGKVLQYSLPRSISSLSLRRNQPGFPFFLLRQAAPDPPIAEFVGLLSVFRTSRVTINWAHITFSHRLVELWIDQTIVENDSELRGFFAALSSACELKELTLIAIRFDPGLLDTTIPLDVVTLPKLEFLYVARGYLNVLDFILSHIARGPYDFTLKLDPNTVRRFSPMGDMVVDPEHFYAFLKGVPADKLVLNDHGESPWQSGTGLHRTLESIPGLKTLILNDFKVNSEVLMGLKSPVTPQLSTSNNIFPILTRLEFHNTSLTTSLIDLKPELEAALESHRIQKMVFGARFGSAPGVDGTPVDDNDEVIRWMRDSVPQFDLSSESTRMPEAWDRWRL